MSGWAEIWIITAISLHLAAAAACALAALWVWRSGDKSRPDRISVIVALCFTALWSLVVAALGTASTLTACAEIARNISWIMVVYHLFANDGRHESLKPIRPVVFSLLFVECLQFALLLMSMQYALSPTIMALVYQVSAMFRVLVAVGVLVLLHNLYIGASSSVRIVLRWSAAAIAALWAFDLNYYTVAYLGADVPIELAIIRGMVITVMTIPLVIGSRTNAAVIRLRPSRSVAFQTLSLLVIGAYFLLMAGIAQSLSMIGGDFGRLTQVGFTFAATVVALLWLPSDKLRGWLRVTAVKHLFQHRYDYRAEWLRFTQTIGKGGVSGQSLQERAIQAMADITDSPSGLLLAPDETGSIELAACWEWHDIAVPTAAIPQELVALFENQSFIIDVDDIRAGKDQQGELALLPDWLREASKAWALVPLLHFDKLTGIIVLTRPAAPRRLDWEDFDLLRVVGQQLASYLAEQSGQQALMDSARFDEFNRRIAFVMHDIKNLASQMSLLARNAEKHAENPEFRADMLVTLRNSADKLNGLLARLGRYGANGSEKRENIELAELVGRITERYNDIHPVSIVASERCEILADEEAFDQALVHIIQNAIDATEDGSPVCLSVSCDGLRGQVEIVDSGTGMSPEFVRNGLFKPFVSSKNAGFGIGAFEAREMIRAMGGRLDVESRAGLGTRFVISFPLADAVSLVNAANIGSTTTQPKSEVA